MKPISQYIFHYNSYTALWACVDREHYVNYMNGKASYEHVTYSESIDSLISMFNPIPDTYDNATQEEKSSES
jgi:hypothetical protein